MNTIYSNIATVTRRAFFALALALIALPSAALAQQDLDQMRTDGVLAESYTGFVVIRNNAAGAQAVADRVNAERRTIYQQRAAEQGVSPEEVGRVYAGQIINKAPAGTWFQNEDGSWIQR
jgi:uncharacterized protein YdbL (DUF1318 family)